MSAQAAKSKPEPLLIKRYASRRLYNTETSDYITLEEIAQVIRDGREVRIIDLRSGDDLTRQYLLQIIAEHESRGENVLPVDLLTDLVRSYTAQAQSVVPQFLAVSFEMLRHGQSKMMEQLATLQHPMASMPGFSEMQRQQQLFLKAMMGGWTGNSSGPSREDDEGEVLPVPATDRVRGKARPSGSASEDEAEDIRRQLAELQTRISKL
ncbi:MULTISPECIES: polyhydroxyalkanoate synthesis repressor PhaR [unclassified Paracoccus (in: a-proteobacteria)]|nr:MULTISPECIES: polyhydroxyalkanoate synthesis repressor PhaR [unclassified Paracoccus (in: a-proteobacteria)]MBB1492827.1 polyhydroxyalkanoate synthesis repressor PhaR [Paracoccus sp. MC1854]MBB1499179.1 polyhydroxyalkanoate synthesis repressor PhaR [Paracoccus sp. MC1862]QQO45786.1 polyhydroxyalkanoate synthesis repressor PhaR [Paracoccus sp. MC1862]